MTEKRTDSIEDLKLFTLTELEPILGVSHQSIVRYVKAGKLPAKKINGKWRVTRADLEAYINNSTEN